MNAKGGSRTPIAFRPPDPKSGASASSATFAQAWRTLAQLPPGCTSLYLLITVSSKGSTPDAVDLVAVCGSKRKILRSSGLTGRAIAQSVPRRDVRHDQLFDFPSPIAAGVDGPSGRHPPAFQPRATNRALVVQRHHTGRRGVAQHDGRTSRG